MASIAAPPRGTRSRKAASVTMATEPLKVSKRATTDNATTSNANADAANTTTSSSRSGRLRRRNRGESDNDHHRSRLADLSQYSQLNEHRKKEQMTLFVLPEGLTPATCSHSLTSAYTAATEANIACKWMKMEDCLTHTPAMENVFVMDPFSGPAFDRMVGFQKKNMCFLLGPQILKYLISDEPSVDFGMAPPVYSAGMRNLLITQTGVVDPVRKNELSLKITRMFGMESRSLTKGVTHVVAENMLTDKVFMAYETNIPVMSTKWIDAVWKDSQNRVVTAVDEKYVKYACSIFHNMTICVSQVTPELKEALRNAIEAHGGQYSPELLKTKTTVLIVPKPEGDKFKYAQQWRVPCVIPEWVEACKSAGHVKSPADFLVTSRFATPITPIPTNKERLNNVVSSTPFTSMVEPLHRGGYSMISNINGTCPREMLTNIENTEEDVLKRASELLKNYSQNEPFLDGCQIYISKNVKSEDVRKLVNGSGAMRLSAISDRVTHVIVPQDNKLQISELQQIKELDPRPQLVRMEWLLESAKEGAAINDEKFRLIIDPKNASSLSVVPETSVSQASQLSISALVENVGNSKSKNINSSDRSSKESLEAAAPAVESLSLGSVKNERRSTRHSHERENGRGESKLIHNRNSSVVPHVMEEMGIEQYPDLEIELDHGAASASLPSENSDPSDPTTKTFAGRTFKVAIEIEEESEKFKNALVDHGGKLSDNKYDILIVSSVYSPEIVVKPGAILRTKEWVSDCIENATMEGENQYYYSPLPTFSGILKVLPDVVVAISQYPNSEKEYLSALITAMGGLCQDVFARKSSSAVKRSTHLICPKTDNAKYRAAQKWGTPVVVAEWIIDSFNTKSKRPIDTYDTATRSADSQGTINYIPITPKASSSKTRGGKPNVSKIQLYKDFVQGGDREEQPLNCSTPKAGGSGDIESPAVFKTPVSKLSKTPAQNGLVSFEETDSFLEYCHKNPWKTPDLTMNKSYQEWLKTRPKSPSPTPGELSPIIGIELGFTRADSRMLKAGLARNQNFVRPDKPYFVVRRSSTPVREYQKRTIDNWPELYFGDDDPSEGNAEIVQLEEAEANGTSTSKPRSKRSSDSSPEREEPAEDSSIHIRRAGDARSPSKRRKISCDSEPDSVTSAEAEEGNVRVTRNNSSTSNRKKQSSSTGPSSSSGDSRPASLSIHSNESEVEVEEASAVQPQGRKKVTTKKFEEEADCSNGNNSSSSAGGRESSESEARQTYEDRPARRMEKLKNLLAGSSDAAVPTSKSSKVVQKNRRTNEVDDDDKPNEEELDAPAVVWATEPDVRALPGPSESQRGRRKSPRVSPATEMPSNTSNRSYRRNTGFQITVPPNPVFILSGLNDEGKALIKSSLMSLGAVVTDAGNFDQGAFAILADTLARSEKILCGIASGKPLLHSGYVDACRNAKEMLPVTEDFLWKENEEQTPTLREIAKAAHSWVKRIHIDKRDTPFRGQSFFLSDAKKSQAFARLIQAGGGTVATSKEEATIVLCTNSNDLQPTNGTRVEHVSYLSNMILGNKT